MTDCTEFFLDDLKTIIAIPVDKYSPDVKFMLSATINQEDYEPVYDSDTIVIGGIANTGLLIPIIIGTGKIKDDTSDNVAGRLHTISVTCSVDDRNSEVWNTLIKLENTPSHLEIISKNGERFFVQADKDTYLCTTERDGSKRTVSLRIHNIAGCQRIVES